jgi:hypothetical protein
VRRKKSNDSLFYITFMLRKLPLSGVQDLQRLKRLTPYVNGGGAEGNFPLRLFGFGCFLHETLFHEIAEISHYYAPLDLT